jgi:hypothetical protein
MFCNWNWYCKGRNKSHCGIQGSRDKKKIERKRKEIKLFASCHENYVTSAIKKDKDVETILGTLKKTVFGGNKSLHAPLKYDNASYMLVPA